MNKRNILFLCDLSRSYCVKLEEYFRRRVDLPFRIQSFTDEEAFINISEEESKQAAALVISRTAFSKMGIGKFDRVLLLEERNSDGTYPNFPEMEDVVIKRTDRYQSMDKICDALLEFCMENPDTLVMEEKTSHLMGRIGFYSPIKRSGQSTLAREMASYFGEKENVLYLSLEPFSGIDKSKEDEDMLDLLYYYRTDKGRFPFKLQNIVKKADGYDYVPPANSFISIRGVNAKEWNELIEAIRKTGLYQKILIDIAETTDGFLTLLESCDNIFTTILPDEICTRKLSDYEIALRISGYDDLLEKTLRCQMPYDFIYQDKSTKRNYIENLLLYKPLD